VTIRDHRSGDPAGFGGFNAPGNVTSAWVATSGVNMAAPATFTSIPAPPLWGSGNYGYILGSQTFWKYIGWSVSACAVTSSPSRPKWREYLAIIRIP